MVIARGLKDKLTNSYCHNLESPIVYYQIVEYRSTENKLKLRRVYDANHILLDATTQNYSAESYCEDPETYVFLSKEESSLFQKEIR